MRVHSRRTSIAGQTTEGRVHGACAPRLPAVARIGRGPVAHESPQGAPPPAPLPPRSASWVSMASICTGGPTPPASSTWPGSRRRPRRPTAPGRRVSTRGRRPASTRRRAITVAICSRRCTRSGWTPATSSGRAGHRLGERRRRPRLRGPRCDRGVPRAFRGARAACAPALAALAGPHDVLVRAVPSSISLSTATLRSTAARASTGSTSQRLGSSSRS